MLRRYAAGFIALDDDDINRPQKESSRYIEGIHGCTRIMQTSHFYQIPSVYFNRLV